MKPRPLPHQHCAGQIRLDLVFGHAEATASVITGVVWGCGRVVSIHRSSETPFFWERTALQIERYGMPEIYAFSTDFPHPEGGTDPIGRMAADMQPLGDAVLEAFFIHNAELLLPA